MAWRRWMWRRRSPSASPSTVGKTWAARCDRIVSSQYSVGSRQVGHNMIIDGHVHFDGPEFHDALMADIKRTGAEQLAVLMYEPQSRQPDDFHLAAGMWLKAKHPDRVYL